jgi:predicted helicase
MEEQEESSLPGMASLTKESHLAGEVKSRTPILAILGNPPYSGHSLNTGEWISKEIREYFKVDGKPLGEKNPKWLQDDYVKFIRFAQWKIEQAGEGILGFITNHSYLDNPTFRGMRQSLMNTFNEMYILDLHGNSLKKEVCPDGSKDENVFDIRQGVAIAVMIKKKGEKGSVIYHSELWGLREDKYKKLLENDTKTIPWKKLTPKSCFYLFITRDERLLAGYEKHPKITDIFPLNGVGMTTARDSFVIDNDRKQLLNRIRLFRNDRNSDDELHQSFQINKKKGWSIRKAWEMLQEVTDEELEDYVLPVLYRPFDIKWIFYHDAVVWRTAKRVMRHMLKENLGLITCRQISSLPWQHSLVTDGITDNCYVSNKTRERGYCFPLYLYPDEKYGSKTPNISPELVKSLAETYGKQVSPEEIFYYIYGILYSETYRKKYAEFLKIDFPRIPFTKDRTLFLKIGELGKQLVDLHLLKSPESAGATAKFEGEGDSKVEKPVYKEKEKRVYINGTQYFEGIEKEVWDYQIGGYQVMNKWLKDRKGTALTHRDIVHYSKISSALQQTIDLQKSLNALYKELS